MHRRPRAPCRPVLAALVAIAATAVGRAQGGGDALARALRERVAAALVAARPALLAHLHELSAGPARAGELALMVLAAIHDGIDPADPVLARAVGRLFAAEVRETYDVALRLLVAEVLPTDPARQEAARQDTRQLLTHRDDRGAFGYTRNVRDWDLSNTQYAALGLRAAMAMGVPVERSVWLRMAREIGEQQDGHRGFGYKRRADRGSVPGASMTAAGIAVLAVCRQALGDQNPSELGLDRRIALGWKWFAGHQDSVGSVTERWCYYFHYGLERACILTDVLKVGDKDWYAEGARMLVDAQLHGGGWESRTEDFPSIVLERGRGASVPTAFAVLFLRRKFQKAAGPITPRVVTLDVLAARSKPDEIAACSAELVRRGKEALPEVLRALRSDVEPRRRAAATALAQIAGDAFGYDAAHDAEHNRDAVRKAELWYLRNR
jgi:hypothetical protein